jgi:hypothetical protein
MRTYRSRFLVAIAFTIMILTGAAPAARWSIEDPSVFPSVWYRIVFDNNGDQTSGDGDGAGWYYYPASDCYRMWFHNGDFDTSRKGRLYYHVYVEAVDITKTTYAEISFVWTSAAWSQSGHESPPYASDVPTLDDEYNAMSSDSILTIDNWNLRDGSRETESTHVIEDFNPEWTGIEIKGRNAYIFRGAFHECLPKTETLLGACCDRKNGMCFITTESECRAPYEWLGAGTTCEDCRTAPALSLDFGDAPDPNYPTLLANNGARHTVVAGLFLGRDVDAEPDGQPNTAATGDDAGRADEDGVVFASTLQPGADASIEVAASAQGYLNAWIDFDADGSFAGQGEQVFVDTLLTSGVNRLTFAVPANAVPGPTFARFRFNSRGLLDYDGPADDGEVEDYRVAITESYEPHPTSGATALVWSQLPASSAAEPYTFEAGSELSALHLHQLAADDWQVQDDRPITGIHWWGVFDGWTESSLPPELPVAFHIGIWTDIPDPEPYNFNTFAHPDTLIWESYCTNWTWALSGYERGDKGELGATCFQFTHLLSQDQWFQVGPAASTKGNAPPTTYWLSITALYDLKTTKPTHVWAWKTCLAGRTAAAVSLQEIVPPMSGPAWPPVLGSQWQEGRPLRDRAFSPLDMAFQLTTYAPMEYPSPAPAEPKVGAVVGIEDLTILAAQWLAAAK